MPYNQYTDSPITGYDNTILNRVDNNSNAAGSEESTFPTKFDLFVNKENASLGGFAVTEVHTLSQIAGSTLYLDHRPAVDYTGGIGTFTISNGGIIDTSQTDVIGGSIEFSTLPSTTTFTVSYTAAADKIQDSHLNALQNTVLNIQGVLGVRSPVNGQGTGIVSLPIVSTFDPVNGTELTNIRTLFPEIVLLKHLEENVNIASSTIGAVQGITIAIGSTGVSARDTIIVDTNSLTIKAADGSAAVYNIGTSTGEAVNISGVTTIASQTTIGLNNGALLEFEDSVPIGQLAFYSGAALRVHGGIWFGSGLSGNGNITLNATSGTVVTVTGELDVENIEVSDYAIFNGETTLNDLTTINSPGYLKTNNDITLQTKPNGAPSLIDGLDPSYGAWAVDHPGQNGELLDSIRSPIDSAVVDANPKLAKLHPVYQFYMYPIIAGWTYTGVTNFNKASLSGDKNILLLSTNMSGIAGVGGGVAQSGDYCTGLFNPGDTYIEFKDISAADAYSYPIYSHTPFRNGTIVTGLNVYVAADDEALQSNLAGKKYRLYQPGNVPYSHLSGWAGADAAPTCTFGATNSTDYTYSTVNFITDVPWAGGSSVTNRSAQHKRIAANSAGVAVSVGSALSKSINGASAAGTGIAYIYAVGTNDITTNETSIQLKASPTPFGIASPGAQMGSPKVLPGQHIPVGEVVASTTDGSTWTVVEVTSYRPKGYYDSCWLPLVNLTTTNIPNYGRCLPFYGASYVYDRDSAWDSGHYQFWVQHDLGPVSHRGEIDFHIYIANYGTPSFTSNYNSSLTTIPNNSALRLSARGSQNLWTPYGDNYVSTHTYSTSLSSSLSRGFLKDLSNRFNLTYLDTRYARFTFDKQEQEVNTFKGDGDRNAGYIRVIIKKIS